MANRLQYETSPYLLQHAHNPVDWYPWGDEAFERAAREQKPVLVSIGYAACHWCHVMEHESFEDPQVAEIMNAHFVCIKVDREEHPDVDHLYMDALQAMTGAGGWPLNMFVTPDRKPFYGGTYFPPEARYGRVSWGDLLEALHRAWIEKPEEIRQQSGQLLHHLEQASLVASAPEGERIDASALPLIVQNLLQQADTEEGGFGPAPKFPATGSVRFLLEYAHYHKVKTDTYVDEALQQALLTLDKMIAGGIYDQIGGGFARYATDKQWLVPHFEKMLYDNALLISVLCDAYRITRKERYAEVIRETIAFCYRELHEEHGFYCALDADSEGEEGKFYTWPFDAWQEVMKEAHPALQVYFGVEPGGNWEGTNILHEAADAAALCNSFGLAPEAWTQMLQEAKKDLFRAREKRIRPATDHKILLSWNALMNLALTDAALALDEPGWLQQAEVHMDHLLEVFCGEEGQCLHVYTRGTARIPGKLEDYAYLVKALCRLASAGGRHAYLKQAAVLMDYVIAHFGVDDGRFFYFSSDLQQDIIVRKTELYDGATPSGNSVMMENLRTLGTLLERSEWLQRADRMILAMKQPASRYPGSFSGWAVHMQRLIYGFKELIIAGPDAPVKLREWHLAYHPEITALALSAEEGDIAVTRGKYREGSILFYLCSGFSCLAPFTGIEALHGYLHKESTAK